MAGLGAPVTAHSSGDQPRPCWPSGRPIGGAVPPGSAPASSSSRATSVSPSARAGSSRCHREAHAPVQRGPPGPGIGPAGQPRVTGEQRADPGGVTQDHRGPEVVAGDRRVTGQHAGWSPAPVTDAGHQEFLHLLRAFRGAPPRLGHQARPAGVAVLAGDGQLGGGERHRPGLGRGRVGGDPAQRGRVPGPGGVAQLLGPAAELVQAGPQRKLIRRHVISSPAPHGPQLGRREDDTAGKKKMCCRGGLVLPADPGAPSTRTVIITPGRARLEEPEAGRPGACLAAAERGAAAGRRGGRASLITALSSRRSTPGKTHGTSSPSARQDGNRDQQERDHDGTGQSPGGKLMAGSSAAAATACRPRRDASGRCRQTAGRIR